MSDLPYEVVNHIWNIANIDTKVELNKVFGSNIFYYTMPFRVFSIYEHIKLNNLIKMKWFKYLIHLDIKKNKNELSI